MKSFIKLFITSLLLSSAFISTSYASGCAGEYYQITVTNLTRSQIMSPFIVSTHSKPFSLFTAGSEASPELSALAQDADTRGLEALMSNAPGSREVAISGGPVLPGKTVTVEIPAHGGKYVSLASMLVTTNDAFTGLNGARVRGKYNSYMSVAYDAGAENNDESCAYIPGPPCGNGGAASEEPGEGYVYVHQGIQGTGDLDSSFDWRNPVAKITIKRIRK